MPPSAISGKGCPTCGKTFDTDWESALLLAFVVTYLVVRNHTEKANGANGGDQSADGSGSGGDGSTSPAEANPAGQLASGDTAGPNLGTSLPPLAPVPAPPRTGGGVSRPPMVPPPSPTDDAFAPRPGGQGSKGRGAVSANVKSNNQDWDRILSEPPGPGVSGPSRTTTPTQPPRNGTTSTPPLPRRRVKHAVPSAVRRRRLYPHRPPVHHSGRRHVRQHRQGGVRQQQVFPPDRKGQPPGQPEPPDDRAADHPPRAEGAEARAAKPPRSDIPEGHDRPINARTEYRIDTNDSLYRISMKIYGTPRMMDAIYALNRDAIGPDPERLKLGMILKLPQAHASK